MSSYKKFNGKEGFNAIYHTATGYKCLAKVNCPADKNKEIHFYAKHIVGRDGRPYVEVGYDCEEGYNYRDLMDNTKKALVLAGFEEVYSISNCPVDRLSFCEYASPIPHNIEIRVNCAVDGIVRVFDALAEFISKDCVKFVHDQEDDVEETLYRSLLESMGDEMVRGPGGAERAKTKAREMAHTFIHGFRLDN